MKFRFYCSLGTRMKNFVRILKSRADKILPKHLNSLKMSPQSLRRYSSLFGMSNIFKAIIIFVSVNITFESFQKAYLRMKKIINCTLLKNVIDYHSKSNPKLFQSKQQGSVFRLYFLLTILFLCDR